MDRDDVVDIITNNLEMESLAVSPSTTAIIKSSRYLNDDLLSSADHEIIKANIIKLADEVINTYGQRTRDAKRPTKVRDIDVRDAIKKVYCSLPPFCKSR